MRPREAAGLLAGLVSMLVMCASAGAADSTAGAPAAAPPAGDTIRIQVWAVEASNQGGCDPSLGWLRSRLKRTVRYRSFRLVDSMERDVLWQDTQSFALPGGAQLVLLPKGREDEQVLLQVRLLDGRRRLVDTIVRLKNRGTMVFGVERDHHDLPGDRALLVVLRAED